MTVDGPVGPSDPPPSRPRKKAAGIRRPQEWGIELYAENFGPVRPRPGGLGG